jgi:ABC-type Fe3+ transport system substrate-binding protein
MNLRYLSQFALLALLFAPGLATPLAYSAAPSPDLPKAKQAAEAKGYIFETSHDEIVAKAKKERRVRVLTTQRSLKLLTEAFKKKYPFIDLRAEEVQGTDTHQRMVLEMKSGAAKGWDTNYVAADLYDDYLPHQMKLDLLGMAQHGVLRIPPEMIDPVNRNILAYTTNTQVVAYNKKLISEDKVPGVWDDFLKPEFKQKKFVVDIRPSEVAALVPAWGLEKTLQFAKGIAAQNPVWVRGHSRVLAAMVAGEYPMLLGANLNSTKAAMEKDKAGDLAYKVVEPIPLRIGDHEAVFDKAASPYAGLLWLEFVASPEAQKIIESSFEGSVFTPGTIAYQVTRGKKSSLVAWDHSPKMQELQKKVFEAYGFPNAESQK